jgi:hypothetical protein
VLSTANRTPFERAEIDLDYTDDFPPHSGHLRINSQRSLLLLLDKMELKSGNKQSALSSLSDHSRLIISLLFIPLMNNQL